MAKPFMCRGRNAVVFSLCVLSFVIGSTYLWLNVRPLHRNETSDTFLDVPENQETKNTGKRLISSPAPRQIVPTGVAKDGLSLLGSYSQSCNGKETKTLEDRYLQIKLNCISTSEQCYVWHWDVANWTIVYTNVSLFANSSASGRRFCPTPILSERTAKIVHADGKVEYHNCPNDRYPCAPWSLLAAHHDKKLNIRINTSPCCRKQVIESTQHMARVFDKYNITYFLVGGAVIGLVRDGGAYIPYDTDLDVGVDANDYDKILEAFPELKKTGYIFKWIDNINTKVKFDAKGRHWYMVGCVNTHCHTGPGIGLYTLEGDKVVAVAPPWTYPANITVPPIRRMFEGMMMAFPKEPEKYLDFVYGKGKWKTPLDCTKHYYEQCAP